MRALALLCLFPAVVWAQAGLELDLSEPTVPPEFMPTLAVVGVSPAESDPILTSRATQLQPELLKAAQGAGTFSKVMDPTEVATALGDQAAAARTCADYACFQAMAKKLGVQRLLVGSVAKSGPASMLTLLGFDGAMGELVKAEVESNEKQEKAQLGGFAGLQGKSQATKDKEFIKKATPVFYDTLKLLAVANGKIQVDSAEQSAVVTFNGEEAGSGSFEKVVPRGAYEVKVNAAGYLPFETHVTVEEQKVAQVKVGLVAKPIERAPVAAVQKNLGTPVYARPGLYVAAAGLVAVTVGVVLGLGARATQGRAVDKNGDGIVDITRAQAQSAKTQATLANVLVGTGAVAVAGGAVWFILTPSAPAKKKTEEPGGAQPAPPAEGGAGGFTIGVGGTF